MSTAIGNLAPYASFVVARVESKIQHVEDLEGNIVSSAFPAGNIAVEDIDMNAGVGEILLGYHVTESRPAGWTKDPGVVDRLNHLLVIFADKEFAIIHLSDGTAKSRLQDALTAGRISYLAPVEESWLIHSWLRDQALKTLWLGGTHRQVDLKPDSKVLSGSNLGESLDPFGDSTYIAGAARSATAGVSLRRSGVWFGPKRDWASFRLKLDEVNDALRDAEQKGPTEGVHKALATVVPDFGGVFGVFEIQWADAETQESDARKEKLSELQSNYRFKAVASHGASPKDVRITVEHVPSGLEEDFSVVPRMGLGKVFLDLTDPTDGVFTHFVDSLRLDAGLVRIYYDTGHTIVEGQLCLASVQDRAFDRLVPADFAGFDVTQEKPRPVPLDLQNMFIHGDDSLFRWIFERGLAAINIAQPAPNQCWLYCDDGSFELADFVHVVRPNGAAAGKITLFHAKGAGNESPNRNISVSAYEVVTAQAMKNFRRMLADSLLATIEKRAVGHPDRVWDRPYAQHGATSPDACQRMLDAIGTVNASWIYTVVVVQPHVIHPRYQANHDSMAAKQLRSLLFGALAQAKAASAEFKVIVAAA